MTATVTVRWRDLPDPTPLAVAVGDCETCEAPDVTGLIDPVSGILICLPCTLEAVRVGAITEIIRVTR